MTKYTFFLILLIYTSSCTVLSNTSRSNTKIVQAAKQYSGVPYKYGGISTNGMDCSGLIYRVFSDLGENLPRNSAEQALKYRTISKKKIKPGDLVYFKIGKTNKINHTGIVSQIVNKDTKLFIHASTSAGVRQDNLLSKYWKPKFVKATRPNI